MTNCQSKYFHNFTETKSRGIIAHPYNAFSSLIYIYIFKKYKKSNKLIAYLNLFLGIASCLFHSTENQLIEQIDLTLVYANKLIFLLLQLKIASINKIILSYLCLMFSNLYINQSHLDRFIGNYFQKYVLVSLTLAILYSMNGSKKAYILFLIAYISKFSDMFLAFQKVHYANCFQGTAMYHLLTGYAMITKLEDLKS